ncbi:MAG TPA: response regulator [Pyrinomonadaceae bacterium]|nr:response regulator [Pyrinomonadaceae bacterium]
MILEQEPAVASNSVTEESPFVSSPGDLFSESEDYLRQGIRNAQAGNRNDARVALLRSVELNPGSENAWLWLASISEYPEELLGFLNHVLEINPANQRAIEWRSATNALLAKTFLQRGHEAVEQGMTEQASDMFSKALEHDQNCSAAWLNLANLADSNEGKLLYLEKALAIDPDNVEARAAFADVRKSMTSGYLEEAKAAAVAGRVADANELLDAVLEEMPDSEDAWMLRSHFAAGFEDKIAAFQRVLEINPENVAARAGLESLRSLLPSTPVAEPAVSQTVGEVEAPVEEPVREEEPEMSVSLQSGLLEAPVVEDKSPTEDLVMPEGVAEAFDAASEDAVETVSEEPVAEFNEPAEEAAEPEAYFEEPAEEPAAPEAYFEEPAEPFVPVEEAVTEEVPYYEALQETAEEEVIEQPEALFEPQPTEEYIEQPPMASELSFVEAADDESIDEVRYDAPIAPPAEEHVFEPQAEEPNPFATRIDPNASFDPFSTIAAMPHEVFDAARGFIAHEPVAEEPQPEVNEPQPEPQAIVEAEPMPDFGSMTMFTSAADPFSAVAPSFGDEIPRPETSPAEHQAASTVEDRSTNGHQHVETHRPCPFCTTENDVFSVVCGNCFAVLSLSDIEMLLANQSAEQWVIRQSLNALEGERSQRPLNEVELTNLGIGYINLREFDKGYFYLVEAAQANPNNVVLASHVNSLHIRIEEIKQKLGNDGAKVSGKTILVVDDSPTIRKLISGKLEKSGHEVFCASDGVEALEMLKALEPDLILLDITMPRMDGYQVCKAIKSAPETKDVPVVMISGKDGFFDKVRGRMAGTSGYITKPFGPETLMKVVEGYLAGDAQAAEMEEYAQ